MTELADTEVKDLPTLNILLCYLLYKIDKPVEREQLYDIAIGTGMINYFMYQDSIGYLLENGHIESNVNESGTEVYTLCRKGIECAKQLKKYAPKSYRDKLVLAALRYFARRKAEKAVKVEYIPVENGCYVRARCPDNEGDLLDLKLFAPDMTQAKIIGERILLNPSGFYGKLVELALSNEEPVYDLSDN